jgi:hypothetical protein
LKLLRIIFLAVLTGASACGLSAQVSSVFNTSGFSGAETVITFNSLTQGIQITNQFSGQGVTFSGAALNASTNSGDLSQFANNAGGVIATTWTGAPANTPWVATFTVPQLQIGFLVEMNTGDTVAITTRLNGTSTGTVSFLSSNTTAVFFGVKDTGGFNSISVSVTGTNNRFFAMDDFRFQAIPEPGVTALMAAGLGLTTLLHFRRRAAA